MMFGGKETKKEETKEAKALKTGKMSVKEYVKGEAKEKAMMKKGKK